MQNKQPEQSTENPTSVKSLGSPLGITEYIFILGLLFLATGSFLVFGVEISLLIIGSALVVTAWINALAG